MRVAVAGALGLGAAVAGCARDDDSLNSAYAGTIAAPVSENIDFDGLGAFGLLGLLGLIGLKRPRDR